LDKHENKLLNKTADCFTVADYTHIQPTDFYLAI